MRNKYTFLVLSFAFLNAFFQAFAQESEPTCYGVTVCSPSTMNKVCVSLSDDAKKLFCSPKNDELVLIKSDGTPVNTLYPSQAGTGFCVYDCSKPGYRTNESVVMKEYPFQVFEIDSEVYAQQNNGTRADGLIKKAPIPLENDGDGVVAIQAVSLLRNWDRHSTDFEPANVPLGILDSHAKHGVHSIRVLPRSFLEGNLQLKAKNSVLTYDNIFTALNKAFVYEKMYEDARIQLADLDRNRLKSEYPETNELYPGVGVPGVFLNEKKDEDECESIGCDMVGPQLVTFSDDSPWGIAKWSSFKDLPDDENMVFMAKDGDTKASWDDIMFFFQVPKSLVASGKSILYRQQNTKGGVDYLIIIKLIR